MPKVSKIYVWDKQVRPALIYDFTESDWWWTKDSVVTRDSNWFYISSTETNGYIYPPAEVFNHWSPKKIAITFNKTGASSWTWIQIPYYLIFVSSGSSALTNFRIFSNPNTTDVDMWLNPTWVRTWEMNIDSSTTNRTITHKITWVNDITDTSWVLKTMFTQNSMPIRIVNWSNASWMKITWVKFYY